MDKITALHIKHALMYYFRFERQWICASECMNNDVMVIMDKGIAEVEIKISKYDLWKGEAKKDKHRCNLNPGHLKHYMEPNRFYICVPYLLLEEAEKWVEATNKKYGIIQYYDGAHFSCSIGIKKRAQILYHSEFNQSLERAIMMRVCSENIKLIGNKINGL